MTIDKILASFREEMKQRPIESIKDDMMDMLCYPVSTANVPSHSHTMSYPPDAQANAYKPCSLASCKATAPVDACLPWKKKDVNPMSSYSTATVVTADSVELTQRRTLRDFAYEAFEAKKTAARKQFGLMGDDVPETMEEAIARIIAGKYVLADKNRERCAYSFMSYITWRDPAIVEDKDGYKAAKAVLQSAYDKLALRLNILPLQDALAEVEAFSAK